ncbi:MAG: hypothetical protein IPK66_06075 [Rhodospirillales bacterium]|nr:hypothetical protein [Rhodospirillales bacterium]
MKIRIPGEMHFRHIMQAIYEALMKIEHDHAVQYSRGVTLYINPTDGKGKDVIPRKKSGEEVQEVLSRGPYRSAADDFKL